MPQVEKMCIDKGLTDESEILRFLQNGTLVGLLPVPHPILIRLIQELLCGSGEITMPFYLILLTFTMNGLKSMIVHLVTRFLGPYDKERYFLFINENRGYKNFN